MMCERGCINIVSIASTKNKKVLIRVLAIHGWCAILGNLIREEESQAYVLIVEQFLNT